MTIKKVFLLGILILIILPGIMALTETISYKQSLFPEYEVGMLLDGKYGWQSDDVLNGRGWEVVNLFYDWNYLTFNLISDFETFSSEDNYATFHIHTDNPISEVTDIGGNYYIRKNGYFDVFLSGDNINWVKFIHLDTHGKDWVVGGWSHTPFPASWKGLNLEHDLYMRYSAGANSNQDYEAYLTGFQIDLEVIILDEDNDKIPDDEDKCSTTEGEQIVYGCSCKQILNLKPGKDKNADCSPGIIKVFTKKIGWAKDLF